MSATPHCREGHIIRYTYEDVLHPVLIRVLARRQLKGCHTLSMVIVNTTSQISTFVLICFPSIQSWQHWLSIPLALLLLLAVGANISILAVIQREQALHEPMYYFLAFLALLDLVLCMSSNPKILGILCFNMKNISLSGCLFQMYIMNSFVGMESATFLLMAYDRYTAICNPLRYPSVITSRFVAKALVFILLRNALLFLPLPILAAGLRYCSRTVIENCICSNLAITSLACDSITVNKVYQLVVGFGLLGSDFSIICLSYFRILWVVLHLQAKGAGAKAFSTCTPHLILISFFYTVMLVWIFTNKMEKEIAPDVPILLNVLHLLVPPALNPIIYGMRTKEIKQSVIKVLSKGKWAPKEK
ncbi:olfactory receptor 56A4-like [Pleurodeles waltl]|uniref:olfactory receptor 56A4-like n=1 Tax=Pleurodeles waltl TaxID=8319 RepID=UPI0037095B2E